jgi:hypothetical protein
MRETSTGKQRPCRCVFRAIFRACYNHFRECTFGNIGGGVSWDVCPGQGGRRVFSRKVEEYIADFCLVSRRTLNDEDHRIFRFYFLLGADWKLCTRQLKMERGLFFHHIYRIQQKLGKAFAELEPYPLYPVNEYFNGERLGNVVPLAKEQPRKKFIPPPRRRAA